MGNIFGNFGRVAHSDESELDRRLRPQTCVSALDRPRRCGLREACGQTVALMMFVQRLGRGLLKVGLVLLASGAVIATACVLERPADPNRIDKGRANRIIPIPNGDIPGSQVVLRQAIDEIRLGREKSATSPNPAANVIRQRFPQIDQVLSLLGPLQSVTYLGSDMRDDRYRTSFKNGSLIWGISVGRGGIIDDLRLTASEGPTPQDWINNYMLVRAGAGRMLIDLASLFILAGFGRFARIRL